MKNAKVLRHGSDVITHLNRSLHEVGSFWLPLMAKTTRRLPSSSVSISESLVRYVADESDIVTEVLAFIDCYNRTMAKSFEWTYKGKALTA